VGRSVLRYSKHIRKQRVVHNYFHLFFVPRSALFSLFIFIWRMARFLLWSKCDDTCELFVEWHAICWKQFSCQVRNIQRVARRLLCEKSVRKVKKELALLRGVPHSVHLMNALALLSEITKTSSARFASFTYCAKGTGEIARHTLRLGASVTAAYRKDLATLEKARPTLSGIPLAACDELIASLRESIEKGVGNNSAYTGADTYVSIAKGLKVHKETGEIYVTGFSRAKVTIEAGTYKSVKSSEKTLAKNALRKRLLSGKIRQFALPATLSARMNGKEMIFE
jgi:hypothetical protein